MVMHSFMVSLHAMDQLFSFQSLTFCAVISEEVMVNHFLPGLRCLRADMEQLSPEHEVSRQTDNTAALKKEGEGGVHSLKH